MKSHTSGEQLSVDDLTLWCTESSNIWQTLCKFLIFAHDYSSATGLALTAKNNDAPIVPNGKVSVAERDDPPGATEESLRSPESVVWVDHWGSPKFIPCKNYSRRSGHCRRPVRPNGKEKKQTCFKTDEMRKRPNPVRETSAPKRQSGRKTHMCSNPDEMRRERAQRVRPVLANGQVAEEANVLRGGGA